MSKLVQRPANKLTKSSPFRKGRLRGIYTWNHLNPTLAKRETPKDIVNEFLKQDTRMIEQNLTGEF